MKKLPTKTFQFSTQAPRETARPKIWAIEPAMTSVEQVVVVSALFAIPPAATASPYYGQNPKINRHC